MATLTDPAREFTDICDRLSRPGDGKVRGDEHLASLFGVSAWSTEFYQIIFCIIQRADYLVTLISELEMDEDLRQQALGHIGQLKSGFSRTSLANTWAAESPGPKCLSAQHIQPIKMLSGMIRTKVAYPKLSEQELAELEAVVSDLEGWLIDHQLADQDFIRQAILEGITQFKFRLHHIGWLGWGYALESLRDVVGAYLALERGIMPGQSQPDAKATAKKVGAALKKIYENTVLLKEAAEVGDFVLKLYGATTIAYQGISSVVGLLNPPA